MTPSRPRSAWIDHLWPSPIEHAERIRTLQATGPLPHYDRYVAGECRAAWADLTALDDAIWTDPVAPDALAVCFETMHRARTNIASIVEILRAEGYQFDSGFYSPFWRRSQESKAWIDSLHESQQLLIASMQEPLRNMPEPHRTTMNAERARRLVDVKKTALQISEERSGVVRPLVPCEWNPRGWLRKIAQRAGDIPLALQVWHASVAGVNLVGLHPELAPPGLETDPLFIAPLRSVTDAALVWEEQHPVKEIRPPFQMPVSPPARVKAGNSAGGAPYAITLPNAALDALVENEPHHLTFVDYLRLAFEWGGFPGCADLSGDPPRLISRLKERMLPL